MRTSVYDLTGFDSFYIAYFLRTKTDEQHFNLK